MSASKIFFTAILGGLATFTTPQPLTARGAIIPIIPSPGPNNYYACYLEGANPGPNDAQNTNEIISYIQGQSGPFTALSPNSCNVLYTASGGLRASVCTDDTVQGITQSETMTQLDNIFSHCSENGVTGGAGWTEIGKTAWIGVDKA